MIKHSERMRGDTKWEVGSAEMAAECRGAAVAKALFPKSAVSGRVALPVRRRKGSISVITRVSVIARYVEACCSGANT